jgi:hypothetical protein
MYFTTQLQFAVLQLDGVTHCQHADTICNAMHYAVQLKNSYCMSSVTNSHSATHLDGQIGEQSSAVDAANGRCHKNSCEHTCDVIVENFKGALVPLLLSKFFHLHADKCNFFKGLADCQGVRKALAHAKAACTLANYSVTCSSSIQVCVRYTMNAQYSACTLHTCERYYDCYFQIAVVSRSWKQHAAINKMLPILRTFIVAKCSAVTFQGYSVVIAISAA